MDNPEQKPSYRELWSEREYLKNLAATVLSRFGDSIDAIAFAWLVYALTGSAALTATTYGVNTLVSVLLQPFTAALITGMRKKPIMVWTAIGRGTLVCATALTYHIGLARPWMLVTVTGLISVLESFGQPAGTAAFPKIIAKPKYASAMALNGAASRGAELAGMGLVGVFIGLLGVSGALLVDAGAFIASGAILMTLRIDDRCRVATNGVFAQFRHDTADGFRYVRRNPLILSICISACALNFALVPFSALQSAFVSEGLKLGIAAMSVIGVCMTLGTAVGAMVYPMLAAKLGRFRLLFLSVMGMSVFYVALAGVPFAGSDNWKWVLLAAVLLPMGTAVGLANTTVYVSFMEKTDEAYLARANGIMSSLCLAAMPVASFTVAAVANYVDVTALIFGCGIFSVLISLLFLLIRPLRNV